MTSPTRSGPRKDERATLPDKMVYIGGAKQAFRCECGCNVFKEIAPSKFSCNACEATFVGER